jgi:hypothetical protein
MGTDINIKVERKQNGVWIESESDENFYDGRNYDLFSALADIRQRSHRKPITPIKPPQGWPEDSPNYQTYLNDMHPDNDSVDGHNWFTVRELLDWWRDNKKKHIMYHSNTNRALHGETYDSAMGYFFDDVAGEFGHDPENVRILVRFYN